MSCGVEDFMKVTCKTLQRSKSRESECYIITFGEIKTITESFGFCLCQAH